MSSLDKIMLARAVAGATVKGDPHYVELFNHEHGDHGRFDFGTSDKGTLAYPKSHIPPLGHDDDTHTFAQHAGDKGVQPSGQTSTGRAVYRIESGAAVKPALVPTGTRVVDGGRDFHTVDGYKVSQQIGDRAAPWKVEGPGIKDEASKTTTSLDGARTLIARARAGEFRNA